MLDIQHNIAKRQHHFPSSSWIMINLWLWTLKAISQNWIGLRVRMRGLISFFFTLYALKRGYTLKQRLSNAIKPMLLKKSGMTCWRRFTDYRFVCHSSDRTAQIVSSWLQWVQNEITEILRIYYFLMLPSQSEHFNTRVLYEHACLNMLQYIYGWNCPGNIFFHYVIGKHFLKKHFFTIPLSRKPLKLVLHLH